MRKKKVYRHDTLAELLKNYVADRDTPLPSVACTVKYIPVHKEDSIAK